MSDVEKHPTKQELQECTDKLEQHEFYQNMINRFGKASATTAATRGEFWGLIVQLIGVIQNLRGHGHGMEARVKALEGRPILEYQGVYAADKKYVVGSLVTYDGSLWHANKETCGNLPGDGSGNWTLCAKRGRDARER